ncbi:MAG: hypothetical protein AB7G13_28670 [Lautropia sp.]
MSVTTVRVGRRSVAATGKYSYLADRDAVWRQLLWMGVSRHRSDPVRARRFAQAKFHSIYGHFRSLQAGPQEIRPPCIELINRIKRDTIAYARRRVAA